MNPDPLMCNSFAINENETLYIMNADDWARSILEPTLNDEVPIEIRKLFEVARGSMLYGYFFYPLFTLAEEQLYRVGEAAIKTKCDQENVPKSRKDFKNKLEYLLKKKKITQLEYEDWETIRKLRNISSHPNEQTILPPGCVIESLNFIADKVNSLFNSQI